MWHGAKTYYYLPQAPFAKLAWQVGLFCFPMTTSIISPFIFFFRVHKKQLSKSTICSPLAGWWHFILLY